MVYCLNRTWPINHLSSAIARTQPPRNFEVQLQTYGYEWRCINNTPGISHPMPLSAVQMTPTISRTHSLYSRVRPRGLRVTTTTRFGEPGCGFPRGGPRYRWRANTMYKKLAPSDELKFSLVAKPRRHKLRKLKSTFTHLCRISIVLYVLKLVKFSLTYQKKPIDPITS